MGTRQINGLQIAKIKSRDSVDARVRAHASAISLHKEKGWGPAKIKRELLKLGFNISVNTLGSWLYHSKRPGKPWRKKQIPGSAKELTEEKAYILGTLAGDGYFHKGQRCRYPNTAGLSVTDKEFADKFAACLKTVYGLEPSRFIRRVAITKGRKTCNRKPIYAVELYAVEVCKDLLAYGVGFGTEEWRVPKAVKRAMSGIKKNYLRSYFDSEGTVYFQENKDRYVAAFSNNLGGLKEVGGLLADIGIESKISKEATYYKIKISRRTNLRKFAELVGFTIKRKRQKLERSLLAYKCTPTAEVDVLVPKMMEMRKQGMLYREIGEELGVDGTTVHKRLLKLGTCKKLTVPAALLIKSVLLIKSDFLLIKSVFVFQHFTTFPSTTRITFISKPSFFHLMRASF